MSTVHNHLQDIAFSDAGVFMVEEFSQHFTNSFHLTILWCLSKEDAQVSLKKSQIAVGVPLIFDPSCFRFIAGMGWDHLGNFIYISSEVNFYFFHVQIE
ncbi:jg27034 [Pararge aegeria aegeria]|uniref:Jg27034 protein n=1 Tax=Pararge aegeria aegeria TaxID=348720 RepID=A0A8S4SJ03_9NEOP|nr:jg27034 [Pararge aegeria aegeria]